MLLIFITATYFIKSAIDSYNYDIDPANGVDLLEGLGAVFALMIGGFVVLYEFDLFYTVYYFSFKPKTKARSILNIFANLSLVLIFVYSYLSDVFYFSDIHRIFKATYMTPIILFFTYIVLRLVYCVVSTRIETTD